MSEDTSGRLAALELRVDVLAASVAGLSANQRGLMRVARANLDSINYLDKRLALRPVRPEPEPSWWRRVFGW